MAQDNDTIIEGKNVEPEKPDTRELFAKGKAHYDKGEYDDAEKYWTEAADLGDENAKVALDWIKAIRSQEFQIENGVLKKYTGKDSDIVIPYGVTSIGSMAFNVCRDLTSIVMPNTLASIEEYAFWCCENLTSITIPNSVTSIGRNPFASCTRLENIKIENGGNGQYRVVCNCLIDAENKNLIWGCKNSIIPSDGSVTSIGRLAFYGCCGLRSITIPNSVISIGDSAFYGCYNLTRIEIPDSVTSIGDDAFSFCSGLTSITISKSVSSIGYGTFYRCSSLTSIEIPDSVTNIGKRVFFWCDSLTSITIPNSVKCIGREAFIVCSNFKAIIFSGNKAEWKKVKKRGAFSKKTVVEVQCNDGTIQMKN